MLSQLGHGDSELSIALVDDAEIRRLNDEWRGKKRSTDVLSFSLLEGDGARHRGKLLGDVVISVETAARQATARHRGLDEAIGRLVVHGLLHILGHDHDDAAEVFRLRLQGFDSTTLEFVRALNDQWKTFVQNVVFEWGSKSLLLVVSK